MWKIGGDLIHVTNDPNRRTIGISLGYEDAGMLVFALNDYLQREEDEDMQALMDNLQDPELIEEKEGTKR